MEMGGWKAYLLRKFQNFFFILHQNIGLSEYDFQQIIFALNRIIQVLISLEYTLLNVIPKSLVTLQFLKFMIVQIKAYIQGFQMRYQSILGHWYPNSYSWFSDCMDILFVLITTVGF